MKPSPNFDLLARPYRWLEYLSFGPFLERARFRFLPQIAARLTSGPALILGDGDGRFTARLLTACPQLSIDAVDLSPAMLAALTRRAGPHAARIATHCADARLWQPAQSGYTLIATHFFLDCLSTPEVFELAARLTPAAAPGALWLVSDFATPPTLFGSLVARPLVAALYLAFRLLTGLGAQSLPHHASALAAAGWQRIADQPHLAGLLVSELWLNAGSPAAISQPPAHPPESRTEHPSEPL